MTREIYIKMTKYHSMPTNLAKMEKFEKRSSPGKNMGRETSLLHDRQESKLAQTHWKALVLKLDRWTLEDHHIEKPPALKQKEVTALTVTVT